MAATDSSINNLPPASSVQAADFFAITQSPHLAGSTKKASITQLTTLLSGSFLTPADIGVLVQAWDTHLDQIAGLLPTADNFIVGVGGTNWGQQSPATVRNTLGLVSGGAGDIWVEKAGDTMTGALTVADRTNAINSGNYPIQLKSDVADGAAAVGLAFDTTNDLDTVGAKGWSFSIFGEELLTTQVLDFFGIAQEQALHVPSFMTVGSADGSNFAQAFIKAPLVEIEHTVSPTTTSELPALAFVGKVASGGLGTPTAVLGDAVVDGGTNQVPVTFSGYATQNTTGQWNITSLDSDPCQSVFQSTARSLAGASGSMGAVNGFRARSPLLASGTPTAIAGFNAQNQGSAGITDAFGFYVTTQSGATNNYGMWFNGDSPGAGLFFGATKDSCIMHGLTKLFIDSDVNGTGDLIQFGAASNFLGAGAVPHPGPAAFLPAGFAGIHGGYMTAIDAVGQQFCWEIFI